MNSLDLLESINYLHFLQIKNSNKYAIKSRSNFVLNFLSKHVENVLRGNPRESPKVSKMLLLKNI